MRVQNIECQLAQGQINRYLNGDLISETALEQLEEHVAECETCAEVLDEKKRALQALINLAPNSTPEQPSPSAKKSEPKPGFAVIEVPDRDSQVDNSNSATDIFGKRDIPKFLVEAIRSKSRDLDKAVQPISKQAVIEDTREPAPAPKTYIKPLMYSLGLAAVLIAMSTVMKDPTRLLGERAKDALPAASTANSGQPEPAAANSQSAVPAPVAVTSEVDLTTVVDGISSAAVDAANTAAIGRTEPAAQTPERAASNLQPTPAANVDRPAPRPRNRVSSSIRRTPTRSAQRPSQTSRTSGITVYDANGNPIR